MITLEGTLKFLLETSSKATSAFGQSFHEKLVTRIDSRRNVTLQTLILKLNNPSTSLKHQTMLYANKKSVNELGVMLLNRLYPALHSEETEISEVFQDDGDTSTLQDQLRKTIETTGSTQSTSVKRVNYYDDFRYLDLHKQRTPVLDKLFMCLKTIVPTSTESERNFSIAGNFVSKSSCSMSDSTLNLLCFLKSFFINNSYKSKSKFRV